MKHHSEDEHALIKIQREWADARLKRDSSFDGAWKVVASQVTPILEK